MNFHWADLHVALLDNYCTSRIRNPLGNHTDTFIVLLLKPEVRQSEGAYIMTKYHVVSRVRSLSRFPAYAFVTTFSCRSPFHSIIYDSLRSVHRRIGERKRKMGISWIACDRSIDRCFHSRSTTRLQRRAGDTPYMQRAKRSGTNGTTS